MPPQAVAHLSLSG